MADPPPRPVLRSPAAVLVLAFLLLGAAPASAVTQKQAASKALAALGAKKAAGPVVVLGLPSPLRAGSRVTQERSKRLVAKVGRQRAFFFYQDSAPFQPYPHAGRVALVGARNGKVRLSRTISRRPLVNGRLPAFLRSDRAYRSSRYLVYDGSATDDLLEPTSTPTSQPSAPLVDDPLAVPDLGPNSPPKADGKNVIVKQGSSKRVTLTGQDDDGDTLIFFITKQPLRGKLTGVPPEVTYTPNLGYLGPDHFTFKATDDKAESNAAQISIDVVPPGLPPMLSTSGGCTAYTEQAAAVAVDPGITATDPDDAFLDSARVRIATGHQGGDNLLFTDQNNIRGSFDENAGVLTLIGTSSVANYQAALRSVQYRNLSSGNTAATKDIEFVVNDAGNDSLPATKQVCVTGGAGGGNNAPTGETGEGGLSYIENDGPVPVDSSFVVGDPDSANLSGATVKFVPLVSQPVDENGDPVGPPTSTDTFDPAQDELAFADQLGITGTYDDTSGVLTLSGTASLADYETAIRAVTYENVSEDPTDLTRRIQFQVTDSSGAVSTPSRRDVFVTPVNDAPEVDASAGSTDYTGSATTVDAALVAIDVDDDDLEGAQVRIVSGAEGGDALQFTDQLGITGTFDAESNVLTLSGTAPVGDYQTALRSVAFANSGDPSGDRTIEFVTNDGELDSAAASKHLEVNDEPVLVATDGALAYTENDGAVAVDSALAVTDVDSPQLAGATVAITTGFDGAQDQLAFTDQNGISGAYDDSTGTLTLSGSASVADYETALRSVTYENVSDDPTTSRTITFQADDGAPFSNLSATVSRDVAITPVNDAPSVDTSDGSTAYTEGDPATAVDAALTVADVDDASLEGAQVSISSGFQDGDELVYVDQNAISGVYDTGTGVLTLSGTASVADYETALRSVEYRNSGDDPSASKTVTFTVNDGDVDSSGATKDVVVTPVNDKPVLDPSDAALAYSEGDGAVAVDGGIGASDPDSANLTGATVTISGGFVEAEDALAFADQNGITGAYDDTSGKLTLSGSASVADYEAALRSVTYENSSDTPSTADRTVTFEADDGAAEHNLSDAVTRTVTVAAVNDAPSVDTSDGSTSYTEGDTATAVDSGVTVADVDDTSLEGAEVRIGAGFESGDALTFVDQNGITGVYNTGTGVLALTGTATLADYETALRSIAYSHAGDNPAASKTVEFVVDDGDDDSAAATKDLAVTGVNDGPDVDTSDTALAYTEGDGAVAVDSGVTATDVDSASLAGATVAITTGFDGTQDELAFTDQSGITGAYDDSTGTLTLSGSASVADYEAALRSVTYENVSGDPTASRTVTFTVDDGGATDSATRDIAITALSATAPVVTTSAGSTTYTIGGAAAVVDGALTVTDADDANLEGAVVTIATGFESGADNLTFVDQNGISGVYAAGTGVLTLTGSATVANYEAALRSITFDYTGGENPSGTRTISFKANDGDSDSNVASKTVDIIPAPEE
ncbi:MAG TPA: Ig-like domain-containing protein [Solirubrobacteraceae bacterium]|nr:Ig-like domain-containing protein [Solirubrobacteraceae bacterium]